MKAVERLDYLISAFGVRHLDTCPSFIFKSLIHAPLSGETFRYPNAQVLYSGTSGGVAGCDHKPYNRATFRPGSL